MRRAVNLSVVTAGPSCPKDGVASLAYVPAVHVFLQRAKQDVDVRVVYGLDAFEAGARAP